LIDGGRKRICTIAGPQEMSAGVDRLDGYLDALPGSLRRSARKLTEYGDFTEESGERAMNALLQRVPDLDAVFVANDLMAAGALRALKAAGRKVPKDVAVIGFDDSVTARTTDPPLTSVRQPVEELGRQLALQLLAQLRTPALRREPVILPTEVVPRESA
jgi:DNA-binding LacI/PurR family transcriptional regulator